MTNFMKNDIRKKIIFVLLALWILIAVIRLVINYLEFLTTDIKLYFISESVKNEELYGDVYPVFQSVENHFPSQNIYLLSDASKAYFYGRYAIYPKKIYWVESLSQLLKLNIVHQSIYILVYHPQNFNSKNYAKYLKSHFVVYKNIYILNSLSAVIYKSI